MSVSTIQGIDVVFKKHHLMEERFVLELSWAKEKVSILHVRSETHELHSHSY